MKQAVIVLAAVLLLAGCRGAGEMQVPEYPWDSTQSALAETLADDAAVSDNGIQLESGTLFGVQAQDISLVFEGGQLNSVLATVPAENRDAMLKAMEAALGAPADSYAPAFVQALATQFSVMISSEQVVPGLTFYWHSPQPLSQTWPEAAQETLISVWREHYEQTDGLSWENRPATTSAVNGEETVTYYGDEAARAYLDNNYEVILTCQGEDGEDCFFLASRILPPGEKAAPQEAFR